jgi:hypothetical protein
MAAEMVEKIINNIRGLRSTYQDELELYHAKALEENSTNPLQALDPETLRLSPEDIFPPTSIGVDEFIANKPKCDASYSPTEKLESLRELAGRIQEEIIHCEQQRQKYPNIERYGHKVTVLNATKNYLCGNIDIDILHAYMDKYPKWNKAFGRSNIKNLVIEALDLKGKVLY